MWKAEECCECQRSVCCVESPPHLNRVNFATSQVWAEDVIDRLLRGVRMAGRGEGPEGPAAERCSPEVTQRKAGRSLLPLQRC